MAPRIDRAQSATAAEPRWSDGTGYHLYLPTFLDLNGDGHGDLAGVSAALSYFGYLGGGRRAPGAPRRGATSGVDWAMLGPVSEYELDGEDGPYQVVDYRGIAPQLGSVAEFRELSRDAELRGIRLMVDFVANHTGEQHAWFQEALRDPASPKRDWYHFFDPSQSARYNLKRPLFPDSTPLPYSHHPDDAVSDALYLHTFYRGQPDLNFTNPEVQAALKEIIRYQLGDLGAGALRLDACTFYDDAPWTTGETQELSLTTVREWVKLTGPGREFPDAWYLAESNQELEIQAEWLKYAHSAYNFHLMSAVFVAFFEEDWTPLISILERLITLDPEGRFSNFLRNHDELSLEKASDGDREFLYAAAAGRDRRYRVNLGLRQRLADLVRDPEAIKTLHLLLVCLRGKPWIYMGDEIGSLGSRDLRLRDPRDGVRTPMQWKRGENAGFSRAPASSLWLPVADDYGEHNVDVQWGRSGSLLEFVRQAIALRRDEIALQRGGQEVLGCTNPRILALVREHPDGDVISFFNISHGAARGYVDLSRWAGCRLEDALEGRELPFLGAERDYLVELPPYGRLVLIPFIR